MIDDEEDKIMVALWKTGFFLLGCVIPVTHAADVVFNITGKIANSACEVGVGGTQTVRLGTFSAGYLQNIGEITQLEPFDITLGNCPYDYSNVQVTFIGDVASGNTQLLALQPGGAENVGIAIYEKDKTSLIPLNVASSGKSVSATEATTLTFYAAYMSTGTVTEGDANADVNFTISYN